MDKHAVVRIEYDTQKSTGFIFRINKSEGLVICTRHAIVNGKENEANVCDLDKLKIIDSLSKEIEIEKHFISEKLDLGFIKVKVRDEVTLISPFVNFPLDRDVKIFGYPGVNREIGVYHLGKLIGREGQEVIIKTDSLDSYYKSPKENTQGLSGAPIYIEQNNRYYFIGMITDLLEGSNGFRGVSVEAIINEISKELPDIFLPQDNFKELFKVLKKRIDNNIWSRKEDAEDFLYQLEKIVEKVDLETSPRDIAKKIEKLWLEKRNEVLNREIWISWLFVLIITYSVKSNQLMMEFNCMNSSRHLYVTYKENIGDIMGMLIDNKQIGDKDIVFLSSIGKFLNVCYSRTEMENIVKDIGGVNRRKLFIDSPEPQIFATISVDKFYEYIRRFLSDNNYNNNLDDFEKFIDNIIEKLIDGE